jgi:hypothetical protein
LSIDIVDISITLELAVRWLDFNFAGVTLASEVKLDHWDAQELGVTSYIGWHWHLRVLNSVCYGERLETLWRISHRGDWNIFDYQIGILKVRLCMVWAKEKLKIYKLSSCNFTMSRLDSVVDFFIFEINLLLILLLVDAPMEWNQNW